MIDRVEQVHLDVPSGHDGSESHAGLLVSEPVLPDPPGGIAGAADEGRGVIGRRGQVDCGVVGVAWFILPEEVGGHVDGEPAGDRILVAEFLGGAGGVRGDGLGHGVP